MWPQRKSNIMTKSVVNTGVTLRRSIGGAALIQRAQLFDRFDRVPIGLRQKYSTKQRTKMANPMPIRDICTVSRRLIRAKSSALILSAVASSNVAVCSPRQGSRVKKVGVKGQEGQGSGR